MMNTMDLINVYKQALQNTTIDDLKSLYNEQIILHPSIKIYLRRICYSDQWKEYRLEILLVDGKQSVIMHSDIKREEYEELLKLNGDKIITLTTDFLNQKYTSFPQAPEELQNHPS